jgi:hypothetical protein
MHYLKNEDGKIVTKEVYETLIETSQQGYFVPFNFKIVNESDYVEDLLDFYIYWIKDREYPCMERPQKGIGHTEKFWEKAYGAVWTEKGLIYVVELDDRGIPKRDEMGRVRFLK